MDDTAAQDRVLHHEQQGVNLTLDQDQLDLEGKANAVEALRQALDRLERS